MIQQVILLFFVHDFSGLYSYLIINVQVIPVNYVDKSYVYQADGSWLTKSMDTLGVHIFIFFAADTR